jgi:hypothetical protein
VRVGGGLNYVEGPMGAGKTLYGVRRIVEAVTRGSYVITNVELRPRWSELVAYHYAPHSRRKRAKFQTRIESLYCFEEELARAMKYRLPGAGEARGVLVWDEGHNDLNNRNWRERARDHATSRGTDALLEWATQLRKLGFVGYLLSQHADNTDAALRRVCNFRVRLQNQREQTRMLGVRVTPWPLFLAYWYPAHLGLTGQRIPPMRVERYFLGWHRHLYDTFGLFHGLANADEEDPDLIRLPPPGVAVAAAQPLPRAGGNDDGPTLPPGEEAPGTGPTSLQRA